MSNLFADLRGKTALITGASSGIGAHFADLLAAYGVNVVLAARRVEALEASCRRIRSSGGDAQAVRMDVTNAYSINEAIESVATNFDILINNAGIAVSKRATDLGEEEWDSTIDTNLKGAFLVAQAVARRSKQAGRGCSIVNVASILGLRVASHVSAYAASKAGLVQLTKSLALEWCRDGIRVNALCPGYIETDLNTAFFASDAGKALIERIPQRRLGAMKDLDGPLLLLCSDAARYITGSTLVVDGGHLVSSL
jgi:NAD(P)-dependent dehydrogenase (short-subunit alcohol dehydrogenase family)